MTPPRVAPETPFQFALSQLTADVKPHVLRTMHGLLTAVLTGVLTADGEKAEQATEGRVIAKMLRVIESQLGAVGSFSSVSPKQEIRYVTPSQLPGAAANTSEPKAKRKATPRGKATPT